MKTQITKREFSGQISYILLGFFAWYLVAPIQDYVDKNVPISPILFGVIGLFITLFIFDFK